MVEREYWRCVRRFIDHTDQDFPLEEFDLGDKLLLCHTVTDVVHELREKRSDKRVIWHPMHYVLVRAEMKERYGLNPRSDLETI